MITTHCSKNKSLEIHGSHTTFVVVAPLSAKDIEVLRACRRRAVAAVR